MNKKIILLLVFFLASCAQMEINDSNIVHQEKIFKNWVLSRCLSYTFEDLNQKQDALNTASAYLEQSTLSVEQLLSSEPVIKNFLSRNYKGSIEGTFNTMKCIDLFNSPELGALYRTLKK